MKAHEKQWKEPSPQEHPNRFILVWDESLKEQIVLFYHELDPASAEAVGGLLHLFFFKCSGPKLSQTLSANHLLIYDFQVHTSVPWLETGQSKGPFFLSALCITLQFRYMAKDWLQFSNAKGNSNVNSLSLQRKLRIKKTQPSTFPHSIFCSQILLELIHLHIVLISWPPL